MKTALKLRDYIRSERVDIVHTFFQTADLWGGLVSKLSGCPILISSRRDMGILRSPGHRVAYRVLNPMFDQVHAVSEAVRQYTLREEHLSPGKVITISNGIEWESSPDHAAIGELRENLKLGPAYPIVLTVSHVRRVKGIDVLIKAVNKVRRSHPQALLVIAGGINEPEYLRELKNLIATLGMEANVRFVGKSEQVRELLQLSDVFCLLSRSEGMSNALLEAMAGGIPCVATAVGGTPEVIEDGCTGHLVATEDAAAAAQRILQLLEDPEAATRMGEAARNAVKRHFGAQRMIDDLVRSYEGLLDERRPAHLKRLVLT